MTRSLGSDTMTATAGVAKGARKGDAMTYNTNHLRKAKGSDERYTPQWIFDDLGILFDIDVAAPEGGPLFTPCKNYFTEQTNGLEQRWHGKVWMNPPYSKPQPWIDKFIAHGNGIALLPTSQGRWWLTLWYNPGTYFTPMPSIKFVTPQGQSMNTAPWRSWLIAIGTECIEAVQRFEAKHKP